MTRNISINIELGTLNALTAANNEYGDIVISAFHTVSPCNSRGGAVLAPP